MNPLNSITDVSGILVGQVTDEKALTGCTVILCENGAIGGVDQRGGAPGTRETDLLRPMHLVEKIHAIVLTGGSAFGLDAASGVMRYLEEKNIGFDTGVARVPIVASAVIFDLDIGRSEIRPDASMGYLACQKSDASRPEEGNKGAGTGATVGKVLGINQAMKSGIGTASLISGSGIIVGAIMVANAFGDVIDPENGQIIAGARQFASGEQNKTSKDKFVGTLNVLQAMKDESPMRFSRPQNTVVGVVVTNAQLSKEQANFVAQMAQDGIARAIRPAHSLFDGDTIFTLATGEKPANVNVVGALAAQVVSNAIIRAVFSAKPAGGLPSVSQ
jgi:L-aminopeptidase/D-esterase-like protein